MGELGSSNVTTINNAHITSGTIEGRTMIALNGTGKQNGVLTVNNGESYLEYFRCREAWMMSPYANGWRVPLIHSKFGVKDSETASDMIDEISFYRGTDGRNYLQITNTKTASNNITNNIKKLLGLYMPFVRNSTLLISSKANIES